MIINSCRDMISSRRVLVVLPDEIVRKRAVIINSSCEMIVLRCVLAILRDEIVRERGGIISSAFEMITCGKNVIAAGKKYLFTSNVDKSAARGSYE